MANKYVEGAKQLFKTITSKKTRKRNKNKIVKPTTPAKPKAAPKTTPKTTPKTKPKAAPKTTPKVAPKGAAPKSDARPFYKKKRYVIPAVIGGASLIPGDGDDKKSKDDKKEGSNASMSFDQAFKSARKEMGTDKVFTWRGKKYSTVTMDEVKKAGFKTLAEYNASKRSKGSSTSKPSSKTTTTSTKNTTKTKTNPGMDYDPIKLKGGGLAAGGMMSPQPFTAQKPPGAARTDPRRPPMPPRTPVPRREPKPRTQLIDPRLPRGKVGKGPLEPRDSTTRVPAERKGLAGILKKRMAAQAMNPPKLKKGPGGGGQPPFTPKLPGAKDGGMMKTKGYKAGGSVKTKACGVAKRGYGKAYMKGKR